MASGRNSSNSTRRILSSLLDNVSSLSEALTTENQSTHLEESQMHQNVTLPSNVEDEVASILGSRTRPSSISSCTPTLSQDGGLFGSRMRPNTSTSSTATTSNNGGQGIARLIGRPQVYRPVNMSALAAKPGPITSNRKRSHKSGKANKELSTKAKGPFFVDVALLRGPEDTVVPKQQPKIELMERGHIVLGVSFYKEWSAEQVLQKVRELFFSILDEIDTFEIATSVHTKIVKPALDRGQTYDGTFLHRMFRSKTMYILPNRELFKINVDVEDQNDDEIDGGDYEDHEIDPPKCPKFDIDLTEDFSLDELPPGLFTVDSNEDISSKQEQWSFENLYSHLKHVRETNIEGEALSVNRVIVRRRKLWQDAMEKITLFYDISESNPRMITPLQVEFVGEEGVDGGGLRREFFCKIFEKSVENLMIGAENMLTVRRDAHKLERKEFENFGKIIALAFLNGCDGPRNWCPNLIQYVLDPDDHIKYDVEAIPDGEVKAKMQELVASQDRESMIKVLECDLLTDARFEAGFNCISVDFQQKNDFIQKICKHFIISKQLEEIQSLRQGMQFGGMLQILKLYKSDAVEQFIYKEGHLSSKEFLNLFNIKYSQTGSAKEKEEDIVYNFTNFLDHIQKKPVEVDVLDYTTVLSMDEAAAKQTDDGGLRKVKVKMEDILQFLTGSKFNFSLKEMKGDISFCHDESSGKRMKINTCGVGIVFPVTDRYIDSGSFSASFVEDMYNSPGFGTI